MESDPTGEKNQQEQRENENQESKAFQAKQDEVWERNSPAWLTDIFRDYSVIWTRSQAELSHGGRLGLLSEDSVLLQRKKGREFEQKAAKETKGFFPSSEYAAGEVSRFASANPKKEENLNRR